MKKKKAGTTIGQINYSNRAKKIRIRGMIVADELKENTLSQFIKPMGLGVEIIENLNFFFFNKSRSFPFLYQVPQAIIKNGVHLVTYNIKDKTVLWLIKLSLDVSIV